MSRLLICEPEERLGAGGASEVRKKEKGRQEREREREREMMI